MSPTDLNVNPRTVQSGPGTRLAVDFGLHVPPPADGAAAETLAVHQAHLDGLRASVRNREKQVAKAGEILAAWKAALIGQAGEANWRKFVEFSRQQRQANFGLKPFDYDPDGLARLAEAKRQARDRSLAILKGAKLTPAELKRTHRKFSAQMARLLNPAERPQRLEIVSEDRLPEGVRKGKGNPWTIRRPPYDGWAWAYAWTRWGGHDPDLVNYLNSATGSIGTRSDYQNWSADDFDGVWIDYDTCVGVWYWPPHAGHVDIWIKARCSRAWYSVYLDDEWGWSDSDTWMRANFTVNVSPAFTDEDIHEAWWSHTWGNPDGTTYGGDVIAAGSTRWYHYTTSDAIPANAWTYVKVGTYDRHTSFLNDVSTHAIMRDWWHVEEIWMDVI